jgi:hypothetical protein
MAENRNYPTTISESLPYETSQNLGKVQAMYGQDHPWTYCGV